MPDSQIKKKVNLEKIVRLVATTMPAGIHNDKLVALIQYELGASPQRAREYLDVLDRVGRLEFDGDSGIWKNAGSIKYEEPDRGKLEKGKK